MLAIYFSVFRSILQQIKPNKASNTSKKEQVSHMFDDISGTYDKANRFISLGMDRWWKRRLVRKVVELKPQHILDLATGTADLPLQYAAKGLKNIIGLDISAKMLEQAKKRIDAASYKDVISLTLGDSEDLPFDDECFDVVTVSYGIRNYENLMLGLKETHRVLKPNGHFIILETSVPTLFPFKQGYALFTKHIMPFVGGLLSGDKKAYKYLSESAANFPCGKNLVKILKESGFDDVVVKPQFFGAASIYVCERW